MNRRLVIEGPEGRTEIHYSALTLKEISHRIRAYEKKYGATFSHFCSRFSCDSATPDEMTAVMDWEYLMKEKAERQVTKNPTLKR